MKMARLLLVGIALAAVAFVLTSVLQSRLAGGEGSSAARRAPREVVVATRDLAAGTVLVDADLSVAECPPGTDARGAVPMPAAVIGRTATVSIRKGQMVREDDLAARGSGAAIASELPPGFRAITVTLRDIGPGVVLYPGASVDVIATVDGPVRGTSRTEAMTRTVVGRSRVLAVNNETIGTPFIGDKEGRGTTKRLSVTLAVTPAQAAQVELASARGSVGIALCSTSDAEAPASELITTSSLLGIPPEPPARSAAVPSESSKSESSKSEPSKPEVPKPEVPKPDAPKPETPKPAPAVVDAATPAPAPVIWEVVVVRGAKSERLGFEQKAEAAKKPSKTPGSTPGSKPSAKPESKPTPAPADPNDR